MRLVLVLLLLLLVLPSAASAQPLMTGVSGGTSADPFATQTDTKPDVFGVFVAWGSLGEYAFDAAERADARLMLHVSTQDGYGTRERITPLGIARGKGDDYLLRMNRRLAALDQPSYVRLLAEMNQVNNGYAAFNRNGSPRGPSHSTGAFKAAWRRAALILRGGEVKRIDAQLRALRLPPVRTDASELPAPDVALAWVPQTRGTPDIPANMPRAYWPGKRYVDWVGTDFYSRFPRFDWLQQFYDTFKGKPFLFGEWALWGADDAGFVKRLYSWSRSHRRVKLLMYNQGALTDGPFRLKRYPRARAELRRQLAR